MDGYDLVWAVEKEPSWCTADLWKGLVISVRLASGSTRELLIQFPMAQSATGPDPRLRPGFTTGDLERHVRGAMADGWDPESRGKSYVYEIRDDG